MEINECEKAVADKLSSLLKRIDEETMVDEEQQIKIAAKIRGMEKIREIIRREWIEARDEIRKVDKTYGMSPEMAEKYRELHPGS